VIVEIIKIIVTFLVVSLIIISFYMMVVRRVFVIINEITPDVDEIKEILRGNLAVSNYYSRIVSSIAIGIAIIISTLIIVSMIIVK